MAERAAAPVPPPRTRALGRRAALALAVVLGLLMLDRAWRLEPAPAPKATWPAGPAAFAAGRWALEQRGHIPMPPATPAAHASFLLPMPTGHAVALRAFWFAGTRESAADVQIAASELDRKTGQWSPARFVLDAGALGQQLGFGVRRLGNPVAWLDPGGRVHLFVVATGLGGWAASRIVHLRESAGGAGQLPPRFEPLRVLPLSWLWNTSFLVRTAPLPLVDGGMVLPVYFELGLKYPVALRFGADGAFLGLVRISRRTHLLQPTLLPLGESDWLALMCDNGPNGRVAAARSRSAGADWQDLPDLGLGNPDASIAGLALQPGRMLLAHNPSRVGRGMLDLSSSVDGRNWRLEQPLERGALADEFSYPSLAWTDDRLWISYTDGRRRIAWQRFAYTPDAGAAAGP